MSAGYSGTPLARKLGITAGKARRVLLIGAPRGFEGLLEDLPADARVSRRASGGTTPDVIVAFASSLSALDAIYERWAERVTGAEMLWIAWPKKSSGVATDVTESLVRERGLLAGLVDNKVCAIDQTWSGLRLVRRVKDRKRP